MMNWERFKLPIDSLTNTQEEGSKESDKPHCEICNSNTDHHILIECDVCGEHVCLPCYYDSNICRNTVNSGMKTLVLQKKDIRLDNRILRE